MRFCDDRYFHFISANNLVHFLFLKHENLLCIIDKSFYLNKQLCEISSHKFVQFSFEPSASHDIFPFN